MEFDEQVSLPALTALCSEQLLRYPRFASRVSEGGHHWEPVAVDVAEHVTEQQLPAVAVAANTVGTPGRSARAPPVASAANTAGAAAAAAHLAHPRRAVEAYVGRVLLKHFDPARPCWTATVLRCDGAVHGATHGAKSFIVWRIAHSIGDGITLASLLMSLATPLQEQEGGGGGRPSSRRAAARRRRRAPRRRAARR
jgi:hypothetical protein